MWCNYLEKYTGRNTIQQKHINKTGTHFEQQNHHIYIFFLTAPKFGGRSSPGAFRGRDSEPRRGPKLGGGLWRLGEDRPWCLQSHKLYTLNYINLRKPLCLDSPEYWRWFYHYFCVITEVGLFRWCHGIGFVQAKSHQHKRFRIEFRDAWGQETFLGEKHETCEDKTGLQLIL